MKAGITIALVLLLAVPISGCSRTSAPDGNGWIVMIYMAGDSSLSSTVDSNLAEIQSVGSSGSLKLIALTDERGEGDSHLYFVKKDGLKDLSLKEIWVKRPDEAEMGREETLKSFLDFSARAYPGGHRMLVIWGHGQGWKGAAQDGEDMLTLPEMRDALSGFHLDIIAFDACSMATMECYCELEEYCNYIIASQKTMPTAGMPYEEMLGNLTGKSPDSAGRMIVDRYMAAYSEKKKDPEGFSVEIALLKTKSGLTQGFREYANGSNGLDLTRRIEFEDHELVDLRSVTDSGGMSGLLNRTVIRIGKWNNSAGSMDVSGACGLSVYCPRGAVDPAYNGTMLAMTTGWVGMIQAAGR
jgi:hypothetical protein